MCSSVLSDLKLSNALGQLMILILFTLFLTFFICIVAILEWLLFVVSGARLALPVVFNDHNARLLHFV